MSKGSRRVMGALFAAVLALVLVVCILCATFARYTTSSTGDSGTVNVELWDVRATQAGTEESYVKTTSLRPSIDEYSATEGRSKDSDPIALLTFKNMGSLDADVTFSCRTGSAGKAEVTLNWDEEFAGWGEGWKEDDGTNRYMQTIMAEVEKVLEADSNYSTGAEGFVQLVNGGGSGGGLFSVKFGAVSGSEFTPFDGNSFTLKAEDQEEVSVYAVITWESYYSESVPSSTSLSGEEFSDAVDTIIGMYVESIGFTIEWEAVQTGNS